MDRILNLWEKAYGNDPNGKNTDAQNAANEAMKLLIDIVEQQ